MLDMGFEPQIRQIIAEFDMPGNDDRYESFIYFNVSSHRQTLMFSATFPKNIIALARDFLSTYEQVSIGRIGSTNQDIEQRIEYVEDSEKRSVLLDILTADYEEQNGTMPLCLVFVETKRMADMLCSYLTHQQFPATSIHGDRTQREREFALYTFKNGRTPILVATGTFFSLILNVF